MDNDTKWHDADMLMLVQQLLSSDHVRIRKYDDAYSINGLRQFAWTETTRHLEVTAKGNAAGVVFKISEQTAKEISDEN